MIHQAVNREISREPAFGSRRRGGVLQDAHDTRTDVCTSVQRPMRAAAKKREPGPAHHPASVFPINLSANSQLFGVLTTGLFPVPTAILPLQPVWATEAMHRALSVFALTRRHEEGAALCHRLEHALAKQIAFLLATLTVSAVPRVLPCSEVLHGLVSGLVGLFGDDGGCSINIEAVPLHLRCDRRRALILATVELVTQMLLAEHKINGSIDGKIELIQIHPGWYVLEASFFGRPDKEMFNSDSVEVLDDMACVLDGELRLYRMDAERWSARLRFPSLE